MATLLKRGLDGVQWDLLDRYVDPLPKVWNGPHVGMRISEGFATLRLLPLDDCRTGMVSCWPAHSYEFDDLLAQAQANELERTQQAQNRTRISPSVQEVTAALETTYWPTRFLAHRFPELCIAVNAVALAHSLDKPAEWVVKKRGGYADTWRQRHDKGCEIIARGLTADRTPVF